MTWAADCRLLGRVRLTAVQVAKIRKELAGLRPMTTEAEAFDVCERYCFLQGVEVAARDGIERLAGNDDGTSKRKGLLRSLVDFWQRAEIDWDVVLRLGNPWFDRIADACRKPTRTSGVRRSIRSRPTGKSLRRKREAGRPARFRSSTIGAKARSEQIARELVAGFLPSMSAVANVEDLAAMTAELGRLAFALAAYREDHGRYPAKLADLSPAYLAQIPKDIFDNGGVALPPTRRRLSLVQRRCQRKGRRRSGLR